MRQFERQAVAKETKEITSAELEQARQQIIGEGTLGIFKKLNQKSDAEPSAPSELANNLVAAIKKVNEQQEARYQEIMRSAANPQTRNNKQKNN